MTSARAERAREAMGRGQRLALAEALEGEDKLRALTELIEPADTQAMDEARERQACRVKVPGSLGTLEDISIRIAGISGRPYGNSVGRQCIVLMCADNGVVEEGVASAPQSVTLMQTINFTRRTTGVGSQAKYFGIDILDIDIGIKLPLPPELLTKDMLTADGGISGLIVDRRIANGTRNLAREPAMSRREAVRALLVGFEAARACSKAGKELIGVGEMGIGNTTTATALISAITGVSPDELVGRGGGLNDRGLEIKRRVVREAVRRYGTEDPIELVRGLGGFDICGMAGTYLGAALYRIPVVIDGAISIAAALLASLISPAAKDYMFTSHRSLEAAYGAAADLLGIRPMFDLGMRLGEGSGCPIAFKIIEAACAVINGMESLDEGRVDSAYLEELRKNNDF